ncbi:MAG TPA: hypothetical protein VGD09_10350 [Blastococcus sp.]
MILAAGLLVLLGLGLFVAGILTGVTVLYWGCVAACVVAAALLVAVRRQLSRPASEVPAATTTPETAATTPEKAATPTGTLPVGATVVDSEPAHGATPQEPPAGTAGDLPDPAVEEVEVTDLLLVVDLKDEVLVVDEHPRYHLAGCVHVAGRTTIPLPLDEARTDGFTPCAVCAPDRNLADRARARKHAAGS